jgi:diacylglycerol kinase family enzyme
MGPHEPLHTHVTALLIAVLNTPSYGAGIHLAPEAKTSDGALDLVILEDRSIFKTLCLLPWLWAKGHLHTDHVQRFRVTCARIETARPCYFHGDGEILGRTPVEISVVPQRCCVLRVADKNQA